MMIDQRGKPYEIAVYESSEAVAKIEAARTGNDEWSLGRGDRHGCFVVRAAVPRPVCDRRGHR